MGSYPVSGFSSAGNASTVNGGLEGVDDENTRLSFTNNNNINDGGNAVPGSDTEDDEPGATPPGIAQPSGNNAAQQGGNNGDGSGESTDDSSSDGSTSSDSSTGDASSSSSGGSSSSDEDKKPKRDAPNEGERGKGTSPPGVPNQSYEVPMDVDLDIAKEMVGPQEDMDPVSQEESSALGASAEQQIPTELLLPGSSTEMAAPNAPIVPKLIEPREPRLSESSLESDSDRPREDEDSGDMSDEESLATDVTEPKVVIHPRGSAAGRGRNQPAIRSKARKFVPHRVLPAQYSPPDSSEESSTDSSDIEDLQPGMFRTCIQMFRYCACRHRLEMAHQQAQDAKSRRLVHEAIDAEFDLTRGQQQCALTKAYRKFSRFPIPTNEQKLELWRDVARVHGLSEEYIERMAVLLQKQWRELEELTKQVRETIEEVDELMHEEEQEQMAEADQAEEDKPEAEKEDDDMDGRRGERRG